MWDLLERTGLVVVAHQVEGDEHVDRQVGQFDPLRDTAATQLLAAHVADSSPEVAAIIVPDGIAAAVLGYAVAAPMGARVVRLFVDEGLIVSSGGLERNMRVLVVSPVADDSSRALVERYLRSMEATVVGTVAVVGMGSSRMRPLADLETRRVPAAECLHCADGMVGRRP